MNFKLILTAAILIPTLAQAKPGSFGTAGGNASVGECNEDLGSYIQTNYDPNKQPRRMYLDAAPGSSGGTLHARLVRSGVDIAPLIYPPRVQHLDGPQIFDQDFKLQLAGQYQSGDGTQLSLSREKSPVWGKDDMVVDLPTPGEPQYTEYRASVILAESGISQPIRFKCRINRVELAKIDPSEDNATFAKDKNGKINLDPTSPKQLDRLLGDAGAPLSDGSGKSLIE